MGTFWYATSVGGAEGTWLILIFLGLITGDVTINGSNGGNPPLGVIGTKVGADLSIANVLNEASIWISTGFSILLESNFSLVAP